MKRTFTYDSKYFLSGLAKISLVGTNSYWGVSIFSVQSYIELLQANPFDISCHRLK